MNDVYDVDPRKERGWIPISDRTGYFKDGTAYGGIIFFHLIRDRKFPTWCSVDTEIGQETECNCGMEFFIDHHGELHLPPFFLNQVQT